MNYSKRTLTFDDAKNQAKSYPYVLAHMMSEIVFGRNEDISIDWDELIEARFFSEEEELHIFKCEKSWRAVVVTDGEDSDETITRSYEVANHFKAAAHELFVKDYLAADEDGQMCVQMTRLCGIA